MDLKNAEVVEKAIRDFFNDLNFMFNFQDTEHYVCQLTWKDKTKLYYSLDSCADNLKLEEYKWNMKDLRKFVYSYIRETNPSGLPESKLGNEFII